MTNNNHSSHDYYVIAIMLAAILLFFFGSQYLWHWLTYDLRDGRWACELVSSGTAAGTSTASRQLSGIEGRFVWSASTIVLLLTIATVIVTSVYVLLATIRRWRSVLGSSMILVLAGLLLTSILTIDPDYNNYLQLAATDQECVFDINTSGAFNFSRYLLLILHPHAGTGLLNALTVIEQLLPIIMLACNLFLIAALITIAVQTQRQAHSIEMLTTHFAHFRLLLLLGSTLFTAIALYSLSQYGWGAQVLAAYNTHGVEQLKEIQRGVTLYIGTINSVALILLYLPVGWILWKHAQRLCLNKVREPSRQAQTDWLNDKRLMIFSGPLIRVLLAGAPLLVSGMVMLLEKALM